MAQYSLIADDVVAAQFTMDNLYGAGSSGIKLL